MADNGLVLADSAFSNTGQPKYTSIGTPYMNYTNYNAPAPTPTSNNNNQSGGGLNFSNISSFKPSGGFGGMTSKINNFGAQIGFAPVASPTGLVYGGVGSGGALSAAGYGPLQALPWQQVGSVAPLGSAGASGVVSSAGSMSGATLSGVLGAAGIGSLAGGFIGPMLGLNGTGSSIGGGIGSGIGMAVGGPVGAVIGGLIGGIGGGLFGKKKVGTSASEFQGFIDGEQDSWRSFGAMSKGASTEYANSLGAELGNYIAGAQNFLGKKFAPQNVRGGFNSKYMGGAFFTAGGQDIKFNAEDPASKNAAIDQVLSILARSSGIEEDKITSMLDTLNGKSEASEPFIATDPLIPNAPTESPNSTFSDFLTQYKAEQAANAIA